MITNGGLNFKNCTEKPGQIRMYSASRHNLAFDLLELLCEECQISLFNMQKNSLKYHTIEEVNFFY
jgi:peptidyl-tRNA hydrolase